MQLLDILTPRRVDVAREHGAGASVPIRTKPDAIRRLAELLVEGQGDLDPSEVEAELRKREDLQSTGVGGGVAIPHAKLERLDRILGAVLLCPDPIGFDAIDNKPVSILFAVIGPQKAPGEHIKTLARVSRLLRDDGFRARLVGAESGAVAFDLIAREESRPQP
jgi:PTS system nitrogen regulatory IIA component